MQSKKQRLIEIEEVMEEENIGLGGWLFFVQVGMVLQLLLCLAGIVYSKGDSLKIIGFAIPIILVFAALFSFYRQSKSFRWLFIASTLVLAMDGFLLVEPYNMGFHYSWLSFILVLYIAAIVCLFSSKRLKATFCERGKHIELERRKNLVGTGGWLSLFQLYLFLTFAELFVLIAGLIATFIREDIALANIDALGVLHLVLIPVLMATIVVCLVLFNKRKLAFRYVYIASAALYFVFKLLTTQSHYPVLQIIIGLILHGLVIFALFKSYRVKNTFVK